jgi:enoyl-CoA hydratase/carnithine racemase
MMMTDKPPQLVFSQHAAHLTLARPSQHNRIDPDDVAVLNEHLASVREHPGIRVLVITGTGPKTFSSGYTLDAIVERLDSSFEVFLDALEAFPLPTLCALNGSVYGGAIDLALCCDFRIGVRDTRLFMPAGKIGLHYYPGGLRRYVTNLGLAQSKRLFLTAQPIDAQEMLRIGFLTELVEADALESRVAEYVGSIVDCEPGVLNSLKLQLNARAAGDLETASDRTYYENSLRSEALRSRLGALRGKRQE